MTDLPDLPEGSAIGVLRGKHGVRLRWPRPGRLSGVLGLVCVGLALVAFAAAAALSHAGMDRLAPWFAGPGILLLLVAAVRYGSGLLGPSTLALEPERLVLWRSVGRDAPGALLELRRQRVEIRSNPDLQDRLLWEADCRAMRGRRREAIPREDVTEVGDLGPGRGIAVSSAARFLRFGSDLGDADREWLASVIRRWKDSPT